MKQNKCRRIGITGGVGAGKSSVLQILREEYGAYVIQADEVGRRLRQPGQAVYRQMVEEYGERILFTDGSINAAAVAELVFGDPVKTARLNALVHPAVRAEIEDEVRRAEACYGGENRGWIVVESALLVEGGLGGLCDEIWYIYAPKELRIERLMTDRGYSRTRCEEVISRQKSEEEFRREANAVVDNGGSLEDTRRQIAAFLAP